MKNDVNFVFGRLVRRPLRRRQADGVAFGAEAQAVQPQPLVEVPLLEHGALPCQQKAHVVLGEHSGQQRKGQPQKDFLTIQILK